MFWPWGLRQIEFNWPKVKVLSWGDGICFTKTSKNSLAESDSNLRRVRGQPLIYRVQTVPPIPFHLQAVAVLVHILLLRAQKTYQLSIQFIQSRKSEKAILFYLLVSKIEFTIPILFRFHATSVYKKTNIDHPNNKFTNQPTNHQHLLCEVVDTIEHRAALRPVLQRVRCPQRDDHNRLHWKGITSISFSLAAAAKDAPPAKIWAATTLRVKEAAAIWGATTCCTHCTTLLLDIRDLDFSFDM